jgi:alkylation response protein AidB-like acyl-CoA dehydrogenase
MSELIGGDLDGFRVEVRAWLAANYPAQLRDPDVVVDPEAVWGGRIFADNYTDPHFAWIRKLAERGWTAPTWPKAYGGGGLSREEARVLEEEIAAGGYRAPLFSLGLWMLGPVLLEYGDEAQKQEHIPKIVRGESRWCQGYSEPGAGSDLVSLRMQCEDKGDHWLVNGQKVWTSHADKADWCFCLVRTDTTSKYGGISFLLIDMASPGVETRPIKLISGDSPFCETFFTDVKVPKSNLVGELNAGWNIAKRLLQYERQNVSGNYGAGGGVAGGVAGDLGDLAKKYIGVDDTGAVVDAGLRARITKNKMDFQSFQLTADRVAAESRTSSGPSAATSIVKYAAANFAQERGELMVEILGHQGLGWEGEGFSPDEIITTRGWLRSKGNSIEGGTSEINLNVISKRVLGLPDPK